MDLPELHLEDNEQVLKVMVIAQVVNFEDGQVKLTLACSDDMTWIDQMGMLEAAKYVVQFMD